jgi:hypothetical protein
MDESKLPNRELPGIRTFRICLDRPQPATTLLGVVRRVAAEQAAAGRTGRPIALPPRTGVFA